MEDIFEKGLNRFSLIAIILLLIWISFFPFPLQQEYHLATKIFLALSFVPLVIKKRTSLFKLKDIPLWVFLLAIGVNVLFAQHKDIAFKTYLDLAIPMFFIYYIASDAFSDEGRFNFLARVISILSILVALGGILEFLFAFNPLYAFFIDNPYYERYITNVVRPMSTQYNPAVLGTYLLASLPFNLFLVKQEKVFFRFTGTVGIILNTVVIILTFSRGVFLGLVGMIMFYLFAQKKYRIGIVSLLIVLMFMFVCLYLPYPFSRFRNDRMITGVDGIFSPYRFERCIMTQRIVKEHPLVGLGFRHIRLRFFDYYPGEDIVPYEFRIADNMYLTMLGETGLTGLLGFIIFIFFILKNAWVKLSLSNETNKRFGLILLLSGLVGLLVNMGAHELFYWYNPYLLFCIIIGCIEAFCKTKKSYA